MGLAIAVTIFAWNVSVVGNTMEASFLSGANFLWVWLGAPRNQPCWEPLFIFVEKTINIPFPLAFVLWGREQSALPGRP